MTGVGHGEVVEAETVDWWRAGPGKLPLPGRLEGGRGGHRERPVRPWAL